MAQTQEVLDSSKTAGLDIPAKSLLGSNGNPIYVLVETENPTCAVSLRNVERMLGISPEEIAHPGMKPVSQGDYLNYHSGATKQAHIFWISPEKASEIFNAMLKGELVPDGIRAVTFCHQLSNDQLVRSRLATADEVKERDSLYKNLHGITGITLAHPDCPVIRIALKPGPIVTAKAKYGYPTLDLAV